jgi:hypothetical protein
MEKSKNWSLSNRQKRKQGNIISATIPKQSNQEKDKRKDPKQVMSENIPITKKTTDMF